MAKGESVSVYDIRKEDMEFVFGMGNYVRRVAPQYFTTGWDYPRFFRNAVVLSFYNSALFVGIFAAAWGLGSGLEKMLS